MHLQRETQGAGAPLDQTHGGLVLQAQVAQLVRRCHAVQAGRIEVQAQCEFKDAQGFPVDSTPWTTVVLTERGQEGVKFVSMNDKAKRYTVRVREVH